MLKLIPIFLVASVVAALPEPKSNSSLSNNNMRQWIVAPPYRFRYIDSFRRTDIQRAMERASISPQPCGRFRKLKDGSSQLNSDLNGDYILPWVVAVMGDGAFWCNGVLIYPDVVLTVGRCFFDRRKDDLPQVYAGAYNLKNDESERNFRQYRNASKYVVHENYTKLSDENNYALIFLSQPFEMTENVDIVCLPEVDDRIEAEKCVENGWDRRNPREPPMAVEREVEYDDICDREIRLWRWPKHESLICVRGPPGTNHWRRNVGSPISCQIPGESHLHTLIGMVSAGDNGDDELRGVAKVLTARTWIDQHLAANNISTYVLAKEDEDWSAPPSRPKKKKSGLDKP